MNTINKSFCKEDYVVYPGHGVGRIVNIEEKTFSDNKIEFYVIKFDTLNNNVKNLTLRIPKTQAKKCGMRFLTSISVLEKIFEDICKEEYIKPNKEIWNKRVKEYEKKINSGNINNVVSVLKELNISDKSYSEKILFEEALDMLSEEYSISKGIKKSEAKKYVNGLLEKKLSINNY